MLWERSYIVTLGFAQQSPVFRDTKLRFLFPNEVWVSVLWKQRWSKSACTKLRCSMWSMQASQKVFVHKNAKISINFKKTSPASGWLVRCTHISPIYALLVDFTCLNVLLGWSNRKSTKERVLVVQNIPKWMLPSWVFNPSKSWSCHHQQPSFLHLRIYWSLQLLL